MKLRLVIGGRKITLTLPSKGDIELDLSQALSEKEDSAKSPLGPTASLVYGYLRNNFEVQRRIQIDAALCCEGAQVNPVVFGKALASLSKNGLIVLYRRMRVPSGKVEKYEIEIQESSVVDEKDDLSAWERVLEDIRSQVDDIGVELFVALCKFADVDGNVVGISPSEIVARMDMEVENFPASIMAELVEGGWVADDDGQGVVATIVEYAALVAGGMPFEEWRSE